MVKQVLNPINLILYASRDCTVILCCPEDRHLDLRPVDIHNTEALIRLVYTPTANLGDKNKASDPNPLLLGCLRIPHRRELRYLPPPMGGCLVQILDPDLLLFKCVYHS